MLCFWRRARKETTETVARHMAAVKATLRTRGIGLVPLATVGKDVPTVKNWDGTAARGFVNGCPHLRPRDNTVGSFCQWIIDLKLHGEWLQDDLRDEYEMICAIADFTPVSVIDFGNDLVAAGCRRWQADWRRNGKRWRPYIILVPTVSARRECLSRSAAEAPDNVLPLPAQNGRLLRKAPSLSKSAGERFPDGNTMGDLPRFLTRSSRTGTGEGIRDAA